MARLGGPKIAGLHPAFFLPIIALSSRQAVIIKNHLCGLAIAYEPHRVSTVKSEKNTSRPQGSRYGQQKRKIADAVEYMRLYGDYKPLIFVATSPGFTSLANEQPLISALTHNLRNGYGVKNYVWVREATKKGFPHFHFVVDTDFIDVKKLSLYWSSLFSSTAVNSIRLGTKPDKNGKRIFHVYNSQIAWYFTKYFSKQIGKKNSPSTKPGALDLKLKKPRAFGISTKLASLSKPLVYGEEISMTFAGLHQRDFVLSNEQADFFYEREEQPPAMNPYAYNWRWTGHGNTYIGRPKKWKKKTKPSGDGSTGKIDYGNNSQR